MVQMFIHAFKIQSVFSMGKWPLSCRVAPDALTWLLCFTAVDTNPRRIIGRCEQVSLVEHAILPHSGMTLKGVKGDNKLWSKPIIILTLKFDSIYDTLRCHVFFWNL